MKKIFLSLLIFTMALIANAENSQNSPVQNDESIYVESGSGTVFRGTQRLRCRETGWEIYMYSSGKFEMYDEDGKFIAVGTYSYNSSAGEVYVYETDGSLAYKCRVSVSQNQQVNSLTLAGKTYYKKSN